VSKGKAMRNFEYLGPCPVLEDGIQMNQEGHYAEVVRFRNMLREKFINLPETVSFAVKENPHDAGSYYEVIVRFDDDEEESSACAYFIQDNYPQYWTETNVVDWEQVKEKVLVEKQ